jgi:polyhydroxyalkanoate synthesis repressor PhaR
MTSPSSVRTIKKYPNRRLYDTIESRYVTLADIRELVIGNIAFSVIDQRTRTDITQCILLQVICDQEQNGDAILSTEFLSQVIRAYSHARSASVAGHLTEKLQHFLARKNNFLHDSVEYSFEQRRPKIP